MIQESPGPPDPESERASLVHREFLQLGVLIAIAVLAFLGTRAFAIHTATRNTADARESYARGQDRLAAGEVDLAVDAFRHALALNRSERQYALALSDALISRRDYDSARSLLLAWRAGAPEDPVINLHLARLAATRQDVTEALRFYNNVLYAPVDGEGDAARPALRVELAQFLLAQHQAPRAVSELLVAEDRAASPEFHLTLARLFAEAGETGRALEHYEAVLGTERNNALALAGAGNASFHLRNYAEAERYFDRARPLGAPLGDEAEITSLVLGDDPLAARLSSSERRRRLQSLLVYAADRLAACSGTAAPAPADAAPAADDAITSRLERFTTTASKGRLDAETLESGMGLVSEAVDTARRVCPPTARDRAIALILERHGLSA
jgi:tetratricopeptide (TPR) repeat protein